MSNVFRVYFEPYRRSVLLIILLLILQVVFQILIIILIKPIIVMGINEVDTDLIVTYGSVMLVLIVLYALTTIAVSRKAARISAESVSRIRNDMFKKVLSFKRPRDSGANMSGLMNRLVTDVNYIQDFITEFLCLGLYVPLLAVGVIAVTAFVSPFLSLAMLLSIIVMTYLVIYLSRRQLKVRSTMQRYFDRTIHLLREIFVGARTARSFDMEKGQHDMFSEYNKEYSGMIVQNTSKASFINTLSTLVLMLAIVAFYLLMVVNLEVLDLTPSELVVIIQYLVLFITCTGITPFIVMTLPQVRASFGRISKVMNGQSEPSGADIPDCSSGPLLTCSNGLMIRGGEEVSLVGRTGAGKSELIRSLLRLDEVEPGTIFFKGVDITELDPKRLRASIAYAGDLAMAFKGKVSDNVKVWRDVTDERMREAMAAAKVELDPEMRLEKFGSNISIGQIQKISIARALASDAELYIFDDCFTELDPKTENEIVSNIRGMLRGRTVLFLSHQLRISPGSDTVSIMDDGRIIDTGSHEDLVDRCEIYRRMYMVGGGIVE